MKMRVCTKCGQEKPETNEYFCRNKSCRGGLCTICKECICRANRRYYAKNSEKVREVAKRWQSENLEKVRKKNKRWAVENPEKVKEARRRWDAKNHEKVREIGRAKDRRCRNELAPYYLKGLISAKYYIDRSEIGDELIEAKRRELKYYRQLKQLKK